MAEPARSPDLDKAVEAREALALALLNADRAWDDVKPATRLSVINRAYAEHMADAALAALPLLPSPEQEGPGRVTWHDSFARCRGCSHATVGLSQPYAINHAEGCVEVRTDGLFGPSPEQVREDTDAVEAVLRELECRIAEFPDWRAVAAVAVETAKPFIVAEALREVEEALRGLPPAHVDLYGRTAADLIRDRFRAGGEQT